MKLEGRPFDELSSASEDRALKPRGAEGSGFLGWRLCTRHPTRPPQVQDTMVSPCPYTARQEDVQDGMTHSGV